MEIDLLLAQYRSLETRAGILMQGACAPFCRACKTSCCREAICREALESPFLHAIHGTGEDFDERLGFCGSNGCILKVGRPPICHAFVCHRVLAGQPDDAHRYALECLGHLVGFMGSKVWRGRHLVQALTDGDLLVSNVARFVSRMNTAATALGFLDAFMKHGYKLNAQEMSVLSLIRKP